MIYYVPSFISNLTERQQNNLIGTYMNNNKFVTIIFIISKALSIDKNVEFYKKMLFNIEIRKIKW